MIKSYLSTYIVRIYIAKGTKQRSGKTKEKILSGNCLVANKYANEAQEAKKADKPHNIGAILFFLPGMGFTMHNIEEASKAAKERAVHLNKLKEKKNC